jgi:hypothetical protein
VVAIHDREQRIEPPKHAIGAPFLGELHGRTRQILRKALELLLEAREQREGIGRRSRESGEHTAAAKGAHLLRVGFHHGVADAHLAVAGDGHFAIAPNAEDGGRADAWNAIGHAEN